jgi:rare lipoprotein A
VVVVAIAFLQLWMLAQVPSVDDSPIVDTEPVEEGIASYYARRFEGRRTASGERYQGSLSTCAHRTHPFGTILRVTMVNNGKSATCVVNDRGPYRRSRVVDVSRSVAAALGLLGRGLSRVSVTVEPPQATELQ